MSTIGFPPAFNTSAVIRSDPVALLFLSEDMAFLTSSFLIMSSAVDGSIPGVVLVMLARYVQQEEIPC